MTSAPPPSALVLRVSFFNHSFLRAILKAILLSDHSSLFLTSCTGTPAGADAAVESTGSLSAQSGVSNPFILVVVCLCFGIPADYCDGYMQFPLDDIAHVKAQIADGILTKFGLKKGDCTADRIANLAKICVPVRFPCHCNYLISPVNSNICSSV